MLRPAAFSLVVLLAAGCVRYHAQPISPAASLESLESRRLDAPELGAFLTSRGAVSSWPPRRLNLQLLTLAAFYYSPTLDIARAQWAVTRGGVVTAGARPNPTITGGLGYNASTPSSGVTPWIPEVVLDLPIDIAGKRGLRINQARHLSEVARLNLLSAAWQVRSRVRIAFLELLAARHTDSLLTVEQGYQVEVVRILEAQGAAGDVSAFEVNQARLALAEVRISALDVTERRARAQSALAQAIGIAPAVLEGLAPEFADLDQLADRPPANEIRRRALVNRSDVRAALAEYEASQAALRLEVRRQFPDINLGPGYQLDQTESKWSLSLSLPIPLLNRNRGPIAEADARRQEAAARFVALQTQVLAEIEAAVASSAVLLPQLAAADSLVAGLARQEQSAQARYAAGDIGKLQLLGLEVELTRTALVRLDAVVRAQLAVGALEDAMQSPLKLEPWIVDSPIRPGGPWPESRRVPR